MIGGLPAGDEVSPKLATHDQQKTRGTRSAYGLKQKTRPERDPCLTCQGQLRDRLVPTSAEWLARVLSALAPRTYWGDPKTNLFVRTFRLPALIR